MSDCLRKALMLTALLAIGLAPVAAAEQQSSASAETGQDVHSLWQRGTLTDGWFGLGDHLEEAGVSFGLSLTNVYQHNFHGGLRAGDARFSLSYDLGIEADLEALLGLEGALLFVGAEGSSGDGVDPHAIGSVFGTNADAGGRRTLDVTELFYQQALWDGLVTFRVGKIDLTGGFECEHADVAFDCNAFATDETADFLNGGFGNSPTIPFPDNGLGLAVLLHPCRHWYLALGMADAEADARETGFSTTFDGGHEFFYIAETGVLPAIPSANGPLPGAYRIGVWNDRQPRAHLDGSRVRRDDAGVYFSGDQVVWYENADADDEQGLGLFGRIGWADDKVSEIKTAWSFGAQYRGLLPGRDADVVGLGTAQGRFSRQAAYSGSFERVVEAYYSAELAPWLHVSPDFQWVANPGGDASAHDAAILGLRVQMDF